MQKPIKQINDHIAELENTSKLSYMTGSDKDAELKYLIHNKDRFCSALENTDQLLLNNPKKRQLLDIGTSPLTFILKKRYPHIQISTLDISDNMKKRCQKAKIKFIKANLNTTSLPNDTKYDLVIFLEVLEHLKSDHTLILEWIAKILKPRGICLLQTPNKYSTKALLLKLVGLPIWDLLSKRPDYSPEFAHFKEYSLTELVNLIKQQPNLEVLNANYSLYYDTLESSMVYRNHATLLKPLLFVHYILTKHIPFIRRGMEIVFAKK